MIIPSEDYPFLRPPELYADMLNKNDSQENVIMATRRKMYSVLQQRNSEHSDDPPPDDYTVNISSSVRIIK